MNLRAQSRKNAEGFSLVEVALALGIFAFVLTGIIGLMLATVKTGQSAMDDMLVSDMTGDLIGTMRKQDFTGIKNTPNVYFNISGKRLNTLDASGAINSMSTSEAVAQGAIYMCVPEVEDDEDTAIKDASGKITTVNLYKITLLFQWPAGAPNPPNKQYIHAAIARY